MAGFELTVDPYGVSIPACLTLPLFLDINPVSVYFRGKPVNSRVSYHLLGAHTCVLSRMVAGCFIDCLSPFACKGPSDMQHHHVLCTVQRQKASGHWKNTLQAESQGTPRHREGCKTEMGTLPYTQPVLDPIPIVILTYIRSLRTTGDAK